jgi:hypothetical protein
MAFRALTVTPLVGDDVPACEYVTLDEALADGTVEITEVSDAGSVPELRVRNRGARPVLIVDGEELIGAKQNRVINLTVLVAAGADTVIPVSCVEAGRWRRRTSGFSAAPRAQFSEGRASRIRQVSRALALTGERRSDQMAVWDSIASKASRMDARSDTAAMAAIYERHAAPLEEYVAGLAPARRQRGAVYSIGGRPRGLELFDRAATFERVAPKLTRSYAIDAMERSADAVPQVAPASAFIDVVRVLEAQAFPAPGEGQDVRLTGEAAFGAALVAASKVVHLAAFAEGAW